MGNNSKTCILLYPCLIILIKFLPSVGEKIESSGRLSCLARVPPNIGRVVKSLCFFSTSLTKEDKVTKVLDQKLLSGSSFPPIFLKSL
mgnify:CR=1 FL=1